MSVREKLYIIFLVILLICGGGVYYSFFIPTQTHPLKVSFLDIGQGDAIFIEAPNGNQMLVDGGRGRKILTRLGEEMPWYDKSIDVVIGTHPDADHIGGLSAVLDRYEVSMVIEPQIDSHKEVQKLFEASAQKENAHEVYAHSGMKVVLDEKEHVYFEILYPDRDVTKLDTNDASIVGVLYYGTTTFLLNGDAPQSIEHILVTTRTKDIDVDVLKLGHHGSRTSSSEEFIKATSPAYGIVSAGLKNEYGHPHKEVVSLLTTYKIPMLATYESGTIHFLSDGKKITLLK